MKIGIDARLWNQTGVGRYIRNLVIGLDNPKYSSHTFYIYLLPDEFETLQFTHKHIVKRLANIRWHSIREQVVFPIILDQDTLDLMHFTYYSVPFRYRGNYVITLHDLIIYHFMTGEASTLPLPLYRIKHLAYRFLLAQMRKNAKKIIVPLEATKHDVVSLFPHVAKKVEVTKEGFDLDVHGKETLSSEVEQLTKQEKYFLYVGNAYPHKNLKNLIDAFLSAQLDKTVKLVLVGKDDFFYKRFKLQTTNDSILFLHNVSDYALSQLYTHATALVSPSLMEGFGLPVLEAMSLKTVVVCSDIESFREICDGAAIYFDPHSVQDMAKKLTQVMALPENERQTRIQSGELRAKNFSWEKMVHETVSIYEECAPK